MAWCGHRTGEVHSVAGNMLTGPEVVEATFRAYEMAHDLSLPDRLLRAMQAGEAAGGDRRGRQAAGLKIHRGEAYPILDLRVDDHTNPLAELERLLAVSRERYVHVAAAFATSDNFSGLTERTEIDAAIAAGEARRRADGVASRSHATDTEL
ncbi:uncharacterized protein DUF1028 [Palleronia aestuarii]|uniref:Uncharacterized protein DUF1028 n=1 Tax=Palleronia aestuarii TaxID=568105 RepID=A0A2W7P0G6_9RHOB|nr:DUF1028 domain-containing protein [Palleronia aestuarii]PZX16942.1 uncharacterized protein DUF1028 [Palleronia aestuarii]